MTLFGIKIPKLGLWFWRRLMTWGIVVAAHVTVGWIVWASPGAGYLGYVALGLIAEALLVYSAYFGGTMLERLTQIAVAAASNVKIGFGGISAGATPPANTATAKPPVEQEPSP